MIASGAILMSAVCTSPSVSTISMMYPQTAIQEKENVVTLKRNSDTYIWIYYNTGNFLEPIVYGDTMDKGLRENFQRLEEIATLHEGWNGYNAKPIPDIVISYLQALLPKLDEQPEIFPTACESIQFEYTREDGEILEFELFEDGSINAVIPGINGIFVEKTINATPEDVNLIVKGFYDGLDL